MDEQTLTETAAPQAKDNDTSPSLKGLGGALLGLLQNHLELLGIELQEEKSRGLQLLAFLGLSLIFGLLLIIGLSVAVMLLCWEHYRWQGILCLCLLYAIGVLISGVRAVRLVRRGVPFRASLDELVRTKEQLLP